MLAQIWMYICKQDPWTFLYFSITQSYAESMQHLLKFNWKKSIVLEKFENRTHQLNFPKEQKIVIPTYTVARNKFPFCSIPGILSCGIVNINW